MNIVEKERRGLKGVQYSYCDLCPVPMCHASMSHSYVHVPSGSRDRSIFSIQGCCVKAIITVYVAQYRHHDRITVFKRRYATLCHVMLTIYQKRYKT